MVITGFIINIYLLDKKKIRNIQKKCILRVRTTMKIVSAQCSAN